MLKYEFCRICLKKSKPNTGFVKIFESIEKGSPVSKILIDFAKINVDQSDGLPHIICHSCFENLMRCFEFQKLIVQNGTTLSNLAAKSPAEIIRTISEPLVRIEKLVKTEESHIVQLDIQFDNFDLADEGTCDEADQQLFDPPNSYSEDEDEFPMDDVPEKPIQAEKPRFMCCCCPLQFGEEHEIIVHMKTDHAAIRSKLNIVPVDKDPNKVMQCELCLKYVIGFMKLVEHQSLYKNCKQCVECGEFYQEKGKISCLCKKNEASIPKNKNVERVQCDICSHLVKDIIAHTKLMHSGKLLKCKQCTFTTEQKTKMTRHVTTHMVKKFPCPYSGCGKMFVSSDCIALKLHLPRHTGEKRYVCKICSKAFADCSDCKRHEWQHTGVSPYMCSKCNKMFLRKNHLLTHEQNCAL